MRSLKRNSMKTERKTQFHLDKLLDKFYNSNKQENQQQSIQSISLAPLNRNKNKGSAFKISSPNKLIQSPSQNKVQNSTNNFTSLSDEDQNIIEMFKPKDKDSSSLPVQTPSEKIKPSPKSKSNSMLTQKLNQERDGLNEQVQECHTQLPIKIHFQLNRQLESDGQSKLEASQSKSISSCTKKSSITSKKSKSKGSGDEDGVQKELGDPHNKELVIPSGKQQPSIPTLQTPALLASSSEQVSIKDIINRYRGAELIQDPNKQNQKLPQPEKNLENPFYSLKSQKTISQQNSSTSKSLSFEANTQLCTGKSMQDQEQKSGFTLTKLSSKNSMISEVKKKSYFESSDEDEDDDEDLKEIEELMRIAEKANKETPKKEKKSYPCIGTLSTILDKFEDKKVSGDKNQKARININMSYKDEYEIDMPKMKVTPKFNSATKQTNKRSRYEIEEEEEKQQQSKILQNFQKIAKNVNKDDSSDGFDSDFQNFALTKKILSTRKSQTEAKIKGEDEKHWQNKKLCNEQNKNENNFKNSNILQTQIENDLNTNKRLKQHTFKIIEEQENLINPNTSFPSQPRPKLPLKKRNISDSISEALKVVSKKKKQIVDSDEEATYSRKKCRRIEDISDDGNDDYANFEEYNEEEDSFIDDDPLPEESECLSVGQMNMFSESNEDKQKVQMELRQQRHELTKEKSVEERKTKKKLIKAANIEDIANFTCTICLDQPKDLFFGEIDCHHRFCHQCILNWSKIANQCPMCRTDFTQILKRNFNGTIAKKQPITYVRRRKQKIDEEDYIEEAFAIQQEEDGIAATQPMNEQPTICYKCDSSERENLLLICDVCDDNYCHTFCDEKIGNNRVPEGRWACHFCRF